MRKFLVAFAVLGTFAMVANAADISIYFGRPQFVYDEGGAHTDWFVADATLPYDQPALPGTYTVGIWANVALDEAGEALDVWNGIGLKIVGDDGVVISDLLMDNFDHQIGLGVARRWETGSDFGPNKGQPNDFLLVAASQGFGLGGAMPRELGVPTTDWWSYGSDEPFHYWLGNVTFSYDGSDGAKNVFFAIMDDAVGGVGRRGGDVEVDRVYFGLDEPIGLRGDDWGATSSLPDFTFTPEPASLILLSLAGLFLRRR